MLREKYHGDVRCEYNLTVQFLSRPPPGSRERIPRAPRERTIFLVAIASRANLSRCAGRDQTLCPSLFLVRFFPSCDESFSRWRCLLRMRAVRRTILASRRLLFRVTLHREFTSKGRGRIDESDTLYMRKPPARGSIQPADTCRINYISVNAPLDRSSVSVTTAGHCSPS